MGTLIFCNTRAECDALADALGCVFAIFDSGDPFEGLARSLQKGRTVCTYGAFATTGWRAPEGTVILLSAEFVVNRDRAEVAQAVARATRSYPGGVGGYRPARERPIFKKGDRVVFNMDEVRGSSFEQVVSATDVFVVATASTPVGNLQTITLDRLAYAGQAQPNWLNEWFVPASPGAGNGFPDA